jgi:predicted dehydrogenase
VSKLRALLVGAGGMGRAWAGNLYGRRDMELAGWMDILPDAAGKAIADLKFADVKAFGDLNKALSELKPDFVVDASIPEAHHQVTLDSLAAGAAVLGEKPMAHSMQHAREMIQASERWGKLYMISTAVTIRARWRLLMRSANTSARRRFFAAIFFFPRESRDFESKWTIRC